MVNYSGDTQDGSIKESLMETLLVAISKHIKSGEMCRVGCIIIGGICKAGSVRKYACEKGCIDVLLKMLKAHIDSKVICEFGCGALGTILSSRDLHSKFCTGDVLNSVRECFEKHKDSVEILHYYLGVMREEDPMINDAVARGACTKEAFPKCSDGCGPGNNTHCPKCCVQQKVFRCHTCDKDMIRVYCETCWKMYHQGHDCEELFYPARCATETK